MQSGSNKALFILLTIIIFGILVSLSYWLFAGQFTVILQDVFYKTSEKVDSFDLQSTKDITINGTIYKDYNEYYNTFTPTAETLFNYTDNGDGTCAITQYTGSNKNVVIPKTINGLTVTRIADMAFAFNYLTELIVADTVISIGYLAVSVNNLTSMYIPDSVVFIDWAAFQSSEISELYISKNVTYIGNDAFSFNNLTTIEIPTTIDTIKENLFAGNKLTYVYIPNNITTIEMYAFNANNITSVVAPGILETQIVNETDVFGYQSPTFTYYY